MNIAVYDEDESVLEMIGDYFKRHDAFGANKSIDYFANAEEMLITLKDRAYDIFLLGTRIRGIRGAGHVMYIRKKNNKIITFEQFRTGLSKAGKTHIAVEQDYIGYFNRDKIIFKIGEIKYFETIQREVYVCVEGEKHRITGTLDQEEKKLPDYLFARISQGQLVNLDHVRYIEKDCVYLDNGEIRYASVRRALQTLEKWEAYIRYHSK